MWSGQNWTTNLDAQGIIAQGQVTANYSAHNSPREVDNPREIIYRPGIGVINNFIQPPSELVGSIQIYSAIPNGRGKYFPLVRIDFNHRHLPFPSFHYHEYNNEQDHPYATEVRVAATTNRELQIYNALVNSIE